MSAATKKPPAVGRLTDSNSNSPSSSPTRPARSSTPTSGSPSNNNVNGVNGAPMRTRSIRSSTAVSARAAAHRSSSSLSMSASANGDDNARAETVALIDDLKARLEKADAAAEQSRKQADVLQARLDEALGSQAKLEERVHESEEHIEGLRNEKREAARQIREMETIYEAERSSMMKEKEDMQNREEEMQSVINRLKETLNQRNAEDEYRPTRQSQNSSPSVDNGNFAPPSSLQRSDSRNNSKLLLQKDKLIESLRLELAEAQIKLVETENQGGGRLREVERLLMEARMANARLMEDNESYQLLLQEKTLHGDFGKGDFSYMGAPANQDALNALEGRRNSVSAEGHERSSSNNLGASLADELGDIDDSAMSHQTDGDYQRQLEAELRAAKDQNRALTLYINKIIERLLQHQEFEHILDQSTDTKPSVASNTNKELPAPPPQESKPAPSLLQRAKSIAVGGSATPPKQKPRPVTYMPSSHVTAHNNPETAPSIPIGLGRSASTRKNRPMSEQFFGAPGLVNAMYKGPEGPISPTLSNPRNSAQYFTGPGGPGGATATPRAASSSGAPSAGNFPGMRSETSSVSSESANDGATTTTSASHSPPRTISSGHDSKIGGGAQFSGNRPRPLRLVQEANEGKEPSHAQNKRASWMGWASAWTAKKDEALAASEPIKE